MTLQSDPHPKSNNDTPVSGSAPTDFLSAVEAAHAGGVSWDMRPHLYDGVTQQRLLLDSGSMVTAYPPDPGDKVVPEMKLRAVNGSILKCYGYKDVQVQINRKKYPMRAIKTEVQNPIIGWDFTKKHRLSMDWTDWGDAVLIDKRAKQLF